MTSDEIIKEYKEELKKIIKDYEEELNKRDFARIYGSIRGYLVNAFTALLLKNNINPLIYMNEMPRGFAFALDTIKEFVIPDGFTIIPTIAFAYCRELKSITIPDSITCINYNAFANCDRLKDVYYKGSKEDWKKIEINNDYDYNKSLLNANIHYNS